MRLFDLYFEKRLDLINKIRDLDEKHQLHFITFLQKEKDSANFLSIISETNFARFFDTIADTILHDKPLANKRPDFILSINNQQIIAEVARLNPSEGDQKQLQFESAFITFIEQIKVNCVVDYNYDENALIPDEVDFDVCNYMLNIWLSADRISGDQLQLPYTILMEFLYYSEKLDHVCLISGGGRINFDFRRLEGPNSPLLKKSNKYNELITVFKMPYIICFDLDFHTWFGKRDLYPKLYGSSVANYDRDFVLTKSHLLDTGLYYRNDRSFQKVAGILLCEMGEFTYFHNYASDVKLSQQNEQVFLQWQHPYC